MKKGKGAFYQKSIHRTELDGPLQGAPRMKLPFKPTPENPMIVSVSEIGSFLRCRLQWNWSYRVGIQSSKQGVPRVNGILVHAGKEGWYELPRKSRTPEAMREMARKRINAITEVKVDQKARDLATAMLVGLAEWAGGHHDKSDRAIGKSKVFPEWPFVLPLNKERTVFLRGKIDETFEPTIYRRTLAMDETKTKNGISFDVLDLNNQMTAYLWALWTKFGDRYDRYIGWRTICRRQMPGPRVKAPLFGRESVERDPDELKMWLLDTRRTIKDMLDAAVYPNKTDHCVYDCDFYRLCCARSNKHDLQAIIDEEYTTK
jgi:hypothetical protein